MTSMQPRTDNDFRDGMMVMMMVMMVMMMMMMMMWRCYIGELIQFFLELLVSMLVLHCVCVGVSVV